MSRNSPSKDQLDELVACLRSVKDPRVQGRTQHLLIDIIVISVVGTLCGAEGILELWEFAVAKQDWLEKYLELPNGIPSPDTIARVLAIVDVSQMEKSFLKWVQEVHEKPSSITLDGKYTKGTERTFNRGKKPLLIVSAYSHDLGLSLVETEGIEGDERGAAMACLDLLDLQGVLVDADAGIGSSAIAEKIVSKGGDYLVPLKGNQESSRAEVDGIFKKRFSQARVAVSEEMGHGRGERRTCHLLELKNASESFMKKWPEARTIFALVRERTEEDKRYVIQETGSDGKQSYRLNKGELKFSEDVVYYVSSRKLKAKDALYEVRKHWSIENKVHWVLDVAFREDECRVRAKTLARVLSLIRKIALNIIRGSNTKGSVKRRMKHAAWNNDFLEALLFK
jgi:predicted transposase YbfD/YdcC